MEERPPVPEPLVSAIVADCARPRDTVVLWPGGLDVVPGARPTLRCQLAIPLVVGHSHRAAWLLGRNRRDFSAGDIEHVNLLIPGLRMRVDGSDCSGRRGGMAELTAREVEILTLVARGLTGRAIGHRCGISVRTVQKHLEHIYRKLDCRDRVSAVLRTQQEGLLGPSVDGRMDGYPV